METILRFVTIGSWIALVVFGSVFISNFSHAVRLQMHLTDSTRYLKDAKLERAMRSLYWIIPSAIWLIARYWR